MSFIKFSFKSTWILPYCRSQLRFYHMRTNLIPHEEQNRSLSYLAVPLTLISFNMWVREMTWYEFWFSNFVVLPLFSVHAGISATTTTRWHFLCTLRPTLLLTLYYVIFIHKAFVWKFSWGVRLIENVKGAKLNNKMTAWLSTVLKEKEILCSS